ATGTGGGNDGFSGSVARWQDKSVSGFDVTSGGGAQPSYGVDTKNGNNVLTFDGTTDRLSNAGAVISGSAYTAFIVYERDSPTAREAAFELGGGGSRNGLFLNNSGTDKYNYYLNGSFYNSSASYTVGNYNLVSITQAGTIVLVDVNNVNQIFASTATRTTTTGIYIGDDSTSGDFLQGKIAEVIIYDRALNSFEEHDVENYLASKWGMTIPNTDATLSTNAGSTVDELSNGNITNLVSTDADNSDTMLCYTITSNPAYGYLYNSNTAQILGLSDTFTQGDLNNGYIDYYNTTANQLTDSFDFSVNDLYGASVVGTHAISITPQNDAPSLTGWTQVSFEDFEGGATGWSDNTTTSGGVILTEFLGKHSLEGGAQNTFKTYTLSGTQDYAVISFDMYEIDSWDGESFYVYVDDVPVIVNPLIQSSFNSPADGTSGTVSWSIQETTPFNANIFSGSWNDQMYHYTLTIQTTAASIKLGFSSTLNQATLDESWGVDNIRVSEVGGAGVPGDYQVSEKSTNGDGIGYVTATDPNVGDVLTYSVTGGTGAGVFTINPSTGEITVANAAALDYETTPSYTLDITVTDDGTPAKSDTQTVTINVIDIPENTAPTLTGFGPVSVNENTAPGLLMGTVTSTDLEGDTVTYSITAGNTGSMFSINNATGDITLNGTPDFETVGSYTLTVRGTDNGFGSLFSTTTVTININDLNEAPVIEGWTLVSSENFEGGATGWNDNTTTNGGTYTSEYLGRHTLDGGVQTIFKTYTLSGTQDYAVISLDMYEFDSWDGENFIIYIDDVATYTASMTHTVFDAPADGSAAGVSWTVQNTTPFLTNFAHSGNNDQAYHITLTIPTTAASVKLGFGSFLDEALSNESWGVDNVIVNEVGGNGTPGNFKVSEQTTNGDVVGTVYALDQDGGDVLTYTLTGGTGSGIFSLNSATGEITVVNAAAIDFETTTSYTLDVEVRDVGGLTDTVTLTIDILDAPENTAPTVTGFGTVSINENTSIGTSVGTITSLDAEGDTVTYSITAGNTNGMFAINSSTGAITLSKVPNYEDVTTYTLTVRGRDNGFGLLQNTTTVTININDLNEAPNLDPINAVLATDPNLRYSATTGNFYMWSTGTANFATATANAAAMNLFGQSGYLATITSAVENAFLASMITTSSFFGASDSAVEGDWRWTGGGAENGDLFWQGNGSGSAQNGYYTNWNGSEPNNSGNEDAAQLLTSGKWNDISTGASLRYLIEWDGAAILSAINNTSYSIPENSPLATSVGFVTGIDPDAGDILTYSVIGGTGASHFALNSSTGEITLTNVAAANFELNSSYTLNVRVTDAGGLTDTRLMTINILDQNDDPTDIHITNRHIEENTATGAIIGTFSSTDEDVADTHTYSLISNPGNKFSIIGNDLVLTDDIDYELTQFINLVVRTDDGNGGTFDKVIRIVIRDELDTFVPRQTEDSKSFEGNSSTQEAQDFGGHSRSIILDTMNGGETGQQHAFYGSKSAFQIIRENTTFRIREWLGFLSQRQSEDNSSEDNASETLKLQEGDQELSREQRDFESRYTNIRNALEAIEKFKETDPVSDLAQMEKLTEQSDLKEIDSGFEFLDKEFVDVMTYHEQKQERLRKALLS
ncbi:MAG TPA: cadherin domain-containing protein, partial [Alphaproteobacteria bacterium]|nr:cadherin domain-containing protein [Alphaproteobacteria bacterium]